LLSFPGSAFVRVADGCSNNCSYCAIPLIRGVLHSRPGREIVDEIQALLETGCVEINLIAQDLASYGADRGRFELPALLESISQLKGSFWIRLLYLHPDHFSPDLLDIMERETRILPYFDLPFQHASTAVLQRMGRCGNPESYLDLIAKIRSQLPRAIIRSTFLVGFPGESERDFEILQDFQNQAQLDWVGVFTYSREDGTVSYNYTPRVSSGVARQRKGILEEAQIPISEKRLDRQLGRTLDVLVEEEVQGEDLYLSRGYLQAPEVDGLVVLNPGRGAIRDGPNQDDTNRIEIGRLYPARIIRRNGIDLEAVLSRA
jgi:ribosomal protein S12 methylthiotransferase